MNEITGFNEIREDFLEEMDLDLLGWKEDIPGGDQGGEQTGI